jgi:uncharacterized protein YbcI
VWGVDGPRATLKRQPTVRRVLNLLLLARGPTPEGGSENQIVNEQATPPVSEADPGTQSVRAELSREMVRLYKEQFGRGPTKAKTEFAGPDTILCTLEDSMTPAERSLAEMGEHHRLRDTRLYFQHATEDEFRGVVERVLDRKVRAFVSGMDTEHDVSSEVFYLESSAP